MGCDINKKVVQLTNSLFSTFLPRFFLFFSFFFCFVLSFVFFFFSFFVFRFFFFFNAEKWCGQSRTGRSGSDAPVCINKLTRTLLVLPQLPSTSLKTE